ncbi:MAG: hypothetical protein V4724_14420 [Pseudomonadota bacterium]
MITLTEQQAFLAMFAFLEAEFALGKSDEIGGLLGSMSLMADGFPVDPAVWEQWKESVRAALANEVDAALRVGEWK